MSCLMLDELPLSEQVAAAAAWADALVARTAVLLASLETPATAPVHPPVRRAAAGVSNLLSHAEETAMVEKQIHDHPPLQACYPGHRPRMYQATGDRATVYYVECSLCSVRSPRYLSPDDAAHAWAHRDVMPIQIHVKAVA